MWNYFFALLAPIVLLPCIPLFGRLLARWIIDRPSRTDLAARLDSARRLHKSRACTVGACRCLEQGMTLIECLMALPILMIGLIGLMSVIPYAAQNIQTGSTVSTATFFSNQRIELVRSQTAPVPPNTVGTRYIGIYDDIGCTGIALDEVSQMAGTETPTLQGVPAVDYSRVTTVVDDVPAALCPMKRITVTTYYRGKPLATIATLLAAR